MSVHVDGQLQFFLLRDAVHKRGLCRRAVSVRLSHSGIVSKRLYISSLFSPFLLCRNGERYGHSCYATRMENRTKVSNGTIFSDLQRISEIFTETKHRAASLRLRQLSFLYLTPPLRVILLKLEL